MKKEKFKFLSGLNLRSQPEIWSKIRSECDFIARRKNFQKIFLRLISAEKCVRMRNGLEISGPDIRLISGVRKRPKALGPLG